jgi:hypothetical protein
MKRRQIKESSIQYTVRDIAPDVDRNLRQIADKKESSLNGLIKQILTNVAHGDSTDPATGQPQKYHDLDFGIGSWVCDDEFDAIISEQHRIDKKLWK